VGRGGTGGIGVFVSRLEEGEGGGRSGEGG